MAIQKLSETLLLVELPPTGSKIAGELKAVNEMISEKCDYDVIIDFFKVEMLNTWNISTLLALRSMMLDSGHQLILFDVGVVTKCIFVVAGLRKAFVFANNKEAALAAVQRTESSNDLS